MRGSRSSLHLNNEIHMQPSFQMESPFIGAAAVVDVDTVVVIATATSVHGTAVLTHHY